jgi:hypothetical protein
MPKRITGPTTCATLKHNVILHYRKTPNACHIFRVLLTACSNFSTFTFTCRCFPQSLDCKGFLDTCFFRSSCAVSSTWQISSWQILHIFFMADSFHPPAVPWMVSDVLCDARFVAGSAISCSSNRFFRFRWTAWRLNSKSPWSMQSSHNFG